MAIKYDKTRGTWVREETNGTYTLTAQEAGEMAAADTKSVVVEKVRGDLAAFINAARAMQLNVDDLGLLGYFPNGDNPITDADLVGTGITAETFFKGVQAFAALMPTPTQQQSVDLARAAKR